MSGGVFFCYRREESGFATRAIHDRVVQRLERENVFLDVDNIELGVDWFEFLSERVGACDALVAVVGRDWLSCRDSDNRRRIDDPDDFVRIEIEAALKRGVHVIPVLVDGASMPNVRDLPESLKGFARRQNIEISHIRFNVDVDRLTRALVSILEARQTRDAAEARKAEEERRAQGSPAKAERVAREERERQEAAERATHVEEARQLAEAEAARLAEKQRSEEAANEEHGTRPKKPEAAKTAAEYEEAAQQGSVTAQNILGWYYMNGWGGVTQDYAQAMAWYRLAGPRGRKRAIQHRLDV
jgi:hypothetical protein